MSRTVIAVLTSLLLAGCGLGSANLREPGGALAPCDGGPHCVSSQSKDADRYVEPIAYTGTRAAAQLAMSRLIAGMRGAQVVDEKPGYIHAEFTSPIMRYVDDVELVFPVQRVIHVRSASRIGYYDFNANRERVEAIRKAFAEIQP